MYLCESIYPLVVIIWLMYKVFLGPKVITLSIFPLFVIIWVNNSSFSSSQSVHIKRLPLKHGCNWFRIKSFFLQTYILEKSRNDKMSIFLSHLSFFLFATFNRSISKSFFMPKFPGIMRRKRRSKNFGSINQRNFYNPAIQTFRGEWGKGEGGTNV